MRALAEFIMGGRTQAVFVAVLGVGSVLFAWVGAAALALVTLRKGVSQGLYVTAWATVPAVVITVYGSDLGPLTTIWGALIVAGVLRLTVSWPAALMAVVPVGLAISAVFLWTPAGEAVTTLIQELINDFYARLEAQAQSGGQPLALPSIGAVDISGFMGVSQSLVVVFCVLLARWWQALLYNPGGFRQEFHALRLSSAQTSTLLGLALLLWLLSPDFGVWALVLLVPLFIAGFALAHGLVAARGLGGHWLVVFYLLWLLIGWMKWLMVLAVAVDSVLDLRKRLARPPQR